MLVTAVEAEVLERAAHALGFIFSLTPPGEDEDYGDFVLSDPTPERLTALAAALRDEAAACSAESYAEGEDAANRMAEKVRLARGGQS